MHKSTLKSKQKIL